MYVIHTNTIALKRESSHYFRTKIIEIENEQVSDRTVMEIIEHSCITYGSSYVGRRDFSAKVLQSKHKLPISIHPKRGIYFLPTSSLQHPNCMWINYFHIEGYYGEDQLTVLILSNGSKLYIESTYNQFDMQMKRTSQVIAQLVKQLYVH